jgi:hypothetical protein
MAISRIGYGMSGQEPDFDEALIAMTLASCLLADKQRKLASLMLGHAMHCMEPQSLWYMLRQVYQRQNEQMAAMVEHYSQSHPLLSGGTNGN